VQGETSPNLSLPRSPDVTLVTPFESGLESDPGDFVKGKLLPRAVVELGGARRFVICDRLGVLQRRAPELMPI
jgi:hypothetical protein